MVRVFSLFDAARDRLDANDSRSLKNASWPGLWRLICPVTGAASLRDGVLYQCNSRLERKQRGRGLLGPDVSRGS